MTPFFSILVPSYNRPEYISESLDSILANDFGDFEIIISDDHSPKIGEIEKVLEPYLKNKKISFHRQPQNLREPGNKNFLVNQARGKFNIILGDDDKLYPYSLTKIKECIEKNPGYGLYALGYTVVDEKGNCYYSRHAPESLPISMADTGLIKKVFMSHVFPFWLYHPSTFCCRNGLERMIPYSAQAGIGEDTLFLFDLINSGEKIFVIPQSLFMWRKAQDRSPKGQINQSLGDFDNVRARKNILYHLLSRSDLNPLIAQITSSYEFREKFLYSTIIVEKGLSKDKILGLKLDQVHWDEYAKFSQKSNVITARLGPYVKRSIAFINLFGFKGLAGIVQVACQRGFYRLNEKNTVKHG